MGSLDSQLFVVSECGTQFLTAYKCSTWNVQEGMRFFAEIWEDQEMDMIGSGLTKNTESTKNYKGESNRWREIEIEKKKESEREREIF